MDGVLAAFNGQREDYRAVAAKAGPVVIRPAAGRLAFLDAASDISSTVTVIGIMAAARRVFTPLDATLAGPVQAPGHVWVVTTRQDGGRVVMSAFGYIRGDGTRDKRTMDLSRAH